MNTETLKAKTTTELMAIYSTGGRCVLTKANAAKMRATKVLRAAGVDNNEALAMTRSWAAEVRATLKVDIRGKAE